MRVTNPIRPVREEEVFIDDHQPQEDNFPDEGHGKPPNPLTVQITMNVEMCVKNYNTRKIRRAPNWESSTSVFPLDIKERKEIIEKLLTERGSKGSDITVQKFKNDNDPES